MPAKAYAATPGESEYEQSRAGQAVRDQEVPPSPGSHTHLRYPLKHRPSLLEVFRF